MTASTFMVSFLIGIFATPVRAWAIQKLWGWMTLPLPPLDFTSAVVLSFLFLFLTTRFSTAHKDTRPEWQKIGDSVFAGFVVPPFVVGVCWFMLWIWRP